MPPAPTEIVTKLLSNPTDQANVESLVSPTATYISLNYSNPDLQKLMPYVGTHTQEGPSAILYTFSMVDRQWANEAFEIQTLFGDGGENVAVFGKFTYRSRIVGRACTSPFSIWCRVQEGKIVYMQFMEDTLGTSETFKVGGEKHYKIPAGDVSIA